jgi:hypothetical protein
MVIRSEQPRVADLPTLVELKRILRARGAAGLRQSYAGLRTTVPVPFPLGTLLELSRWAGFNGDDDFAKRAAIAEIMVDSYPASARAHFVLAQVHWLAQRREQARPLYQRALELLASDGDPLNTPQDRERIERVARQNLAEKD